MLKRVIQTCLDNISQANPGQVQRLVEHSAIEYVEKSQYRDELIRSFPVGSDITKRIELDIVRGKAPDCWVTTIFTLALKLGIPLPEIKMPIVARAKKHLSREA
jgi:hypothetical protein